VIPIIEYKETDYEDMREFYFQVLYESRHFIPYTPTLKDGLFNDETRKNYIIRDGRIIAHLTLYKSDDETYTIGVAVLKDYYAQKLGSKMLDFAEKEMKKIGIKKIKASIHKDNWRSILLFIKKGYRIIDDTLDLILEKYI
jgi:ribosomal protein S18 acetylase RimI-like enzyme